jgi:hypothetical protein
MGVDPSINVTNIAKSKGLNVITEYFNYKNFNSDEWKEKYDLILSNNTFAHIIDINDTAKAVSHCLKKGGKFIFEVHYLKNLIDELQWDNIYHEHIYYYSVTTLFKMLNNYDLKIINVEKINIHSGSIRVTAEKGLSKTPKKILKIIQDEENTICNDLYLEKFQKKVISHIESFKSIVSEFKKEGKKIAGYGASGRANMFCNITQLDSDIIEFIVDESPERCGRYIANTRIPIVSIEKLKNSEVNLLIIFAWNYSKMIIEKTKFKNFNYLIAFPEIKIFNQTQTNTIKNINSI